MYRFAKTAVNIGGQAMRQVRHRSSVRKDFHSKYGTGLLLGSTVFFTAIWGYVLTMDELVWNMSPIGNMMPRPWREE